MLGGDGAWIQVLGQCCPGLDHVGNLFENDYVPKSLYHPHTASCCYRGSKKFQVVASPNPLM